ncbi:MAG: enoyl-CoA hydratase/isomerase family protein [Pseudonocardiaceae bacterium]|uniref:enoyl-CoA hydratase/isomerase family protein n=1 Tax=Afipia sp. 1NLS2 TaxID=666684 RepID=UPI0001DA100A|nr:enoyl-CoA hydratase/isomerase family protein [Afipia sp. 1NLS2]EFI52725.1 Enoyl-CoA hydratase/isomerase [Afipia sp. 1NLS2]MBE0703201.1 enoyl-CoA hydratase/isomerase family protein [Afipia sp.]RTL65019.1 MAG: enoyl-CoA hydratase/isomerase family protein [Pseudonocardiaceae bacterium]
MSSPLAVADIGSVTHLKLNRPKVLNALDEATFDAFLVEIARVEQSGTQGAMVISGEGAKAFCAGADLDTVKRLTGAEKRRFVEKAWSTLDRLARSPIPSVVALHGYVLGGGFELSLACDIRIASTGTVFGLPEIALGAVPAFGAIQRLPKLIGQGRAAELMLTGRRFDENEALSIGAITKVMEAEALLSEALAIARQIAERPREALRYLKLALTNDIDGRLASNLHALISDTCHREPTYQAQIGRFAKG